MLSSAEIFHSDAGNIGTTLNVLYISLLTEPGMVLAVVLVRPLGRKATMNLGECILFVPLHSFVRILLTI